MLLPAGSRRFRSIALRLSIAGLALTLVGCSSNKKKAPPPVASKYQQLPPKELPDFLKGTILERVDVANTGQFAVSGYGLVANLNGTGDTRCSNPVREYMLKLMTKRGFGSRQMGYGSQTPERVLDDPRFAIIRVDGLIPPGARRGQRFDVQVSALRDNNTSSLAQGQLYRCDLKIDGADPRNPGASLDVQAIAEGDIFVNPAYALELNSTGSAARTSLRTGAVLGGGIVQMDRPVALRVRQPSYAVARQIEQRLDLYFQDDRYASAKDDGVVLLMMPEKFGTDWEHFKGVVTHVFFNPSPDFKIAKSEQLAKEAVKPDAPLEDISYCWEALGPQALPFITPLMTHPQPDVAFAAARAAAFLGEVSAETVLLEIARTKDNPFQINAVQTLGKLRPSPEVSARLRTLLSSPETLVRLEAYRALAAVEDSAIFSRVIEEKFWLDIISNDGPPLIYATRRGVPRLAVFGRKPTIDLPITFSAMEGKLTISSNPGRKTLTIFYRGPGVRKPVTVESNPDIAELAARLAGAGPPEEVRLKFSYCDVVAIVQSLADKQKVTAARQAADHRVPVAFVLQELPFALEPVYDAPALPGQQRPQTDSPGTVSLGENKG